MKERHRDRIREVVEDYFIDHVATRADGVPEQTQYRDANSLPRRRTLLHRGHLFSANRDQRHWRTRWRMSHVTQRGHAPTNHGDQLRGFRLDRVDCVNIEFIANEHLRFKSI